MSRPASIGRIVRTLVGVVGCSVAASGPAQAFRIELKDVAPDRIERQRAEAIGQLPLPGTPNIAQLDERLKAKGLSVGAPVFIRTFKTESELELWMLKGDRFELFATYPVCHWSGTLGPKVAEGDKQTPEGVYVVTQRQVHISGRHPKALNLGFPNALDRQFRRTGSYILIHGGCGSVGCFAMTNPVIDEIFTLTQAAMKNGQQHIQVHAFPFRPTEPALRNHVLHEWYEFWRNLKDVYDAFERTQRVPRVSVCEGRYWVEEDGVDLASTGGGSQGPLAVCGVAATSQNTPLANAPLTLAERLSPPADPPVRFSNLSPSGRPSGPSSLSHLRHPSLSSGLPRPAQPPSAAPSGSPSAAPRNLMSQLHLLRARSVPLKCRTEQPSCRKWITAQVRVLDRAQAQRVQTARAAGGRRTP